MNQRMGELIAFSLTTIKSEIVERFAAIFQLRRNSVDMRDRTFSIFDELYARC